jgi:type IV secretory pathway VirD2 relaxase
LAREVQADRWTGLDRQLQTLGDGLGGVVDLRPDPQRIANPANQHLIGRATKLERMGLADKIAPGRWRLKPALEQTLRDIGTRGDIIKTMHRAMTGQGLATEAGRFALHNEKASEPVIGRLVERGLHNELTGQAYAVVDGMDEVSGVYRQRIQLASGRFAMIDDGLGFSLVPWSKQLDRHLGQYVSGQPRSGGGIEWTLGRNRSIEI